MKHQYICPTTRGPLRSREDGLVNDEGIFYPFVQPADGGSIPNFLDSRNAGEAAERSLAMYDHETSSEIYRNFLDWLFMTFGEDEAAFRRRLMGRLNLQNGNRVLITGCGLGDDIAPIMEVIGPDGEVYANDLAPEMVIAASRRHCVSETGLSPQVSLAVCDAQRLPFADNFFDGAFHFGGINLFDDIKSAVLEMERTVKPGGRVVFGDEGVAPWLRNTEYGRIAINNNSLWASTPPLDLLPRNCVEACLSWVLGNCFYVIDFTVSDIGPYMNLDVPHKGRRGGTMRTRYFGQLEGVTEESKKFVYEDAARQGISAHDWLENLVRGYRKH